MRILGIDAGLAMPGFAVMDLESKQLKHVSCLIPEATMISDIMARHSFKKKVQAHAVIKKMSQTAYDLERIAIVTAYIRDLVWRYRPSVAVVEFPTGGAKSAAAIKGMAFSTAMTAATLYGCQEQHDFRLVPITPMDNKKGATGLKSWKGVEDDKWTVFRAVDQLFSGIPWPRKNGSMEYKDSECWAMADAAATLLTYARRESILTPGASSFGEYNQE